MRKKLFVVLTCVAVLLVAACGAKKEDAPAQAKPDTEAAAPAADNTGNTAAQLNPVEEVFFPATSSATGAYATIKVASTVELDDETAWLGLCPAGTDYITEEEADEVDVIWVYPDEREEGDPYVYACDFESVEDGTYALVVCSSDDAEIGYVAIQLEATKKGDEITFNFEDAQLKERPAK